MFGASRVSCSSRLTKLRVTLCASASSPADRSLLSSNSPFHRCARANARMSVSSGHASPPSGVTITLRPPSTRSNDGFASGRGCQGARPGLCGQGCSGGRGRGQAREDRGSHAGNVGVSSGNRRERDGGTPAPRAARSYRRALPGGVNGAELAEEVRRRHPDVHIICATGYVEDDVLRNRPLLAGTPLITKPYSRSTLAQEFAAVLSRQRSD